MFFHHSPLWDKMQSISRIYHETAQKVNSLYRKLNLDAILERSLGQLTGRSEDFCQNDRPRNQYFVGSLANSPAQADVENDTPDNDLYSRIAPSAMGLDIRIAPSAAETQIVIQPHFAVYYRVFPSFDQQRGNLSEGEWSEEARTQLSEWAIVYRKVDVTVPPITITVPSNIVSRTQLNTIEAQSAINLALAEVQEQIGADMQQYRELSGSRPVPNHVLVSEEAYSNFLQNNRAKGKEVMPQWQVELQVQARPSSDSCIILSVMLQNVSPEDSRERSLTDHYLFDVHIRLECPNGAIQPFLFDVLPKDYRYERELWGLGHNCSVERIENKNAVITKNAPIYRQPVYTTRDAVDKTLPKATFQTLVDEPLPILRDIAAAMDEYSLEWERLMTQRRSDPDWTEEMLEKAQEDLVDFKDEISRFRRGISVLERYDQVCRAFQLMNQTFVNASKYESWRLFQIVYIVTQFPAVAAREYNEPEGCEDWQQVDVLWFPTGGGKTEAYLGLIVFTAFFDRLRGKQAGVTAWMRFPLRLLSLQQLQRLADIMCAAELVRRETAPINCSNNDPFSIGYLVGSGNTPNALTKFGGGPLMDFQQNPNLIKRCLTIPHCPFCGQRTVEMDLDLEHTRLIHRCTNTQCPEEHNGGVLPIFIVDNDIYRYLPTVIAGTIDKITAVGFQRKFSHLFGAVTHRCPKHGYLSLDQCTEKYAPCEVKPEEFIQVSLKDPSPTLQIQDELHLLREELGAFNSHYETFLDTYQQKQENVRTKIIAATATIEEYETQIAHLYDRQARRFPVPGPTLGESFYATTLHDDTRRLFVGVMPHNYTHINAVVRLAELFHREIEDLHRDLNGAIVRLGFTQVRTKDEFSQMLSNYEIFTTYLLSKREGDRLNQSFEGQLNRELTDAGYSDIQNESIISDTPFSEVAAILDELEIPNSDFPNRLRSITATSTISHGVDVERLNYMCFFGMPRQTAEYIQASSRAGRDHPGIIIICFNPARERDHSHYQLFPKYHEYLDRLVEPVPINRWSKFSIQRTIPGLFMGILWNDYNISMGGDLWSSKKVRQLIERREIHPDVIIEYLKQAYRTSGREAGQDFEEVIKQKVNDYINALRNPADDFTARNLTDSPLTSLRDIDEQLEISVDQQSRRIWNNKVRSE